MKLSIYAILCATLMSSYSFGAVTPKPIAIDPVQDAKARERDGKKDTAAKPRENKSIEGARDAAKGGAIKDELEDALRNIERLTSDTTTKRVSQDFKNPPARRAVKILADELGKVEAQARTEKGQQLADAMLELASKAKTAEDQIILEAVSTLVASSLTGRYSDVLTKAVAQATNDKSNSSFTDKLLTAIRDATGKDILLKDLMTCDRG